MLFRVHKLIAPLLRHFDPIDDDISVASISRSRRVTEITDADMADDYRFLLIDDDGIDVAFEDDALDMIVE